MLACLGSSLPCPGNFSHSRVPNFHRLRSPASSKFRPHVCPLACHPIGVRTFAFSGAFPPLHRRVSVFCGLACCRSAAPRLVVLGLNRPSIRRSLRFFHLLHFEFRWIPSPPTCWLSYYAMPVCRYPAFVRHFNIFPCKLLNTSLCLLIRQRHSCAMVGSHIRFSVHPLVNFESAVNYMPYFIFGRIHFHFFLFRRRFCDSTSSSIPSITVTVRHGPTLICIHLKLVSHSMYLHYTP